jgi:hypothetical protein
MNTKILHLVQLVWIEMAASYQFYDQNQNKTGYLDLKSSLLLDNSYKFNLLDQPTIAKNSIVKCDEATVGTNCHSNVRFYCSLKKEFLFFVSPVLLPRKYS